MALFFQKERGIIVLFFQKGRGMTVFFPQCYKFREHHRRSVGDLWAFGSFPYRVSIIMLQKSSAQKGFCAEDL